MMLQKAPAPCPCVSQAEHAAGSSTIPAYVQARRVPSLQITFMHTYSELKVLAAILLQLHGIELRPREVMPRL